MMMRKKILARLVILGIPLAIFGVYYWFFYTAEKSIETSEGMRNYRLHVPWGINKNQKVPLVISLHGYADSPRLSEIYTGWSSLGDRKRFIVAYPYGTSSTQDPALAWNADFCCGAAVEKKSDDVGFIGKLIKELVNEYPVDKNKVYISGFSNGALLAYKIAANNPQAIKAVGIVAGAIGGRTNPKGEVYIFGAPVSPVNIIAFHGKEDWLVPYFGGSSQLVAPIVASEFMAFDEAKDHWIRANKCDGLPSVYDVGNSKVEKYHICANKAALEFWTISGRNHEWTGGMLEFSIHGTISGPKTTEEMWRFFQEVSSDML